MKRFALFGVVLAVLLVGVLTGCGSDRIMAPTDDNASFVTVPEGTPTGAISTPFTLDTRNCVSAYADSDTTVVVLDPALASPPPPKKKQPPDERVYQDSTWGDLKKRF